MSAVNTFILSQVISLLSKSKIIVIGIDGPTAAGKTILAENLGNELKKKLSVNIEYFRLDWTLREREHRQQDLKNLLADEDDFLLEGEIHMNLDIFEKFLNKVNSFRDDSYLDKSKKTIELNGLYSRENGGKCVGTYKYDFSEQTILICEGHYTSRTEFFNLIDLNICLFCDKEELLKRKVNRVKNYRSSKDAIDYFWKIDIPSFSYHLARYGKCVDFYIDNTDFLNPVILSNYEASNWIKLNKKYFNVLTFEDYKTIDFHVFFKTIFSNSSLFKMISEKQFALTFDFYKTIDEIISSKLQENQNPFKKGINEHLNNEISKLNKKVNNDFEPKIDIFSASNSFLYDVYNRNIPVSLGISIYSGNNKVNFNFTIYMYKCEVIIFWNGGVYEITIERSLTDIKEKDSSRKVSFKNLNLSEISNYESNNFSDKIKLFTPTDFCVPEFLKSYKFNFIFTGREQETTLLIELCKKLIKDNNSVLSHRLSINSEIKFYLELLNSLGIPSLKVTNYIFALNSKSSKLIEEFKLWSKGWFSSDNDNYNDIEKYDNCVLEELAQAEKILSKFSKRFYFKDSFLFSSESNLDKLQIDELSKMLDSENRSLRKRAFQYILKEEPNLEIEVSKIFACYGIDYKSDELIKFQVADLPRIYPSIMAEVYLWQHLRGDKSGILGANIYDIDKQNSLDINALLKASIDKDTGIIFQSSFNAMGQEESDDKKNYHGYLKLKYGPKELVDACISAVLKSIFIKKMDLPFYGIGLDHVDSKNDIPEGRALRFLDLALSTGNITHVVLDGSNLFKSVNRDYENLAKAYQRVVEYEVQFIKKRKDLFLIDLEYCVGELNYIGDSKLSMIPNPNEINLFVDILRKELRVTNNGHFNCRPSLFIGNIGTTHHSRDTSISINSSVSNSWVELVKKKNFISAVLHGTTNSELKILKESTHGCHKVNVAGDFLNVYQSSLPKKCEPEFREFGPNSKYLMPKITELKNSFSKDDNDFIEMKLEQKSKELIEAINSPKLSERDKSYFHRSSYKFPKNLIDFILDEYQKSKKSIIQKNYSSTKKEDLFFSASMIEVPFENGFCEISNALIKQGISHFHIDVGDGKFISRKFSGIKKLSYLSNLNKSIKLHTHLMVEDPMLEDLNGKSYIDNYIEAGSTSIALHLRSFDSKENLKKAIDHIKSKNRMPGIIIEVHDTKLSELWDLICYLKIEWVVVMGVPVGYGGQLFQSRCLRTINYLRSKSLEAKYLNFQIEVDGGLNFNNINDSCHAGANIFAGWSIIRDDSIKVIIENYNKVLNQLKNC